MLRRVELLREARIDLLEASAWYDRKRDGLGAEFELSVEEAMDQIATNPDRFAVSLGDVRRATVDRFPYSVYFRVNKKRIVVVAVFHNSRDTGPLESRK